MAKPIKLKSHSVHIKAPREMVFQKLSSFGRGRLVGDNNESSKVLSRDGDTIIAEFKTRAGPFTYTTVEEITLEPPNRITFRHFSGPLHYAWEEFVFNDVDGDTELVHNGEFIWRRLPLIGRLGGLVYTRPMFERVIEKHLEQVKVNCDARAARSHLFRRREPAPPG
ncbi:MAG: SRPBCC family protein [SAR202 cluster bacterium]|jgi:hypothetical protein|nr:SRPBCC family protein [SAR202 cluster bacterium]